MKQTIAYSAYFLFVATITYFVAIFLYFMISGILFYAADSPPGDISDTSKLLFSVGMPLGYAIVLFGVYYLYSQIIKDFNIHLTLSIGVIIHIIIAIYLIWILVPLVF